MTNPPPWNEPIKPPNGNFTLEERKWREGITRALKNMKIDSLDDIGDVSLSSPTANQILKYDGSNWVNGTPSVTVTNWGDIVGSLSNQTDLQNALNAKVDALSLATVATTGSYNDLIDTPTIPTVNDATLTIQKNSSNVGTFTANASSNATIDITVPVDTGDLTNNAGFITASDIPSLPSDTDLSHYDNTTSGFITASDIPSLPSDTDLSHYDNTTSDFVDSTQLATKQDVIDGANPLSASYVSGLASVATSGDYGDLINKPTIPTVNDATLTIQKNSSTIDTFTANASSNVTVDISVPTDTNDLTNGAGYITGVSSLDDIGDVTITSPQDAQLLKYDGVNQVWYNGSASSGTVAWTDITGKPNFATVATSGDYTDLINTPTIPTVNDATLTIQKNGTNVAIFTANSSSNQTANILVPTDTSDLTNGAGYITSSALPTVNNATLTIQKNGTNVATFTANASSNATANITVPTKVSQLTNDSGFITGSYLPLSGGTMTGNILPNNSSRTIGSTSNYFGNVYTAYVNFVGQGQTNQDIAATNSTTVRLRSNGKNYNFGAGAGGNVAGSDIRLKKNIISMPDGVLGILEQLRPVKFDFKTDKSDESFYAGFIAQEVDPFFPNLAIAPITPETDDMYGIDYAGFVPYLVKAIQELSAKVTALENKLESLGV